jgi:molybdate transport system regulatory protein
MVAFVILFENSDVIFKMSLWGALFEDGSPILADPPHSKAFSVAQKRSEVDILDSAAVAVPNVSQALSDGVTDKRLAILRGVANTGSISEAARQAGVSYKSAWQAIETLSNLAGTALVEKAVGGAGGGGARLTTAGAGLLQASAQWQTLQQAWFKQRGHQSLGLSRSGLMGLTGLNLGMQTSMRNQCPVTVERCERHASRARIVCRLSDGQKIWAQITPESQQLLGLAPGLSVVAMCKASAVSVRRREGAGKNPEGNVLRGQIRGFDGVENVTHDSGGAVSVAISADVCLLGYWFGVDCAKIGDWVDVEVDPTALVIGRDMSAI